MIEIKTYYIKQGKIKLFKKININGKYCEILKKLENKKSISQVIEQITKSDIETVILSKELYKNKEFIEELRQNKIKILDGRWLYKYMVPDIVEYICKKANIEENVEIAILTNEVSDEFLGNIELLSKKFKKAKIVTEHPEKFRKIEKRTLEDSGLSMIITQNKKQALTKTKIIINFDLSEETINQYNINENAIIVNLSDEIKIKQKRFNGIIIKDYEIQNIRPQEKEKLKKETIENRIQPSVKTEEKDSQEFYIKHIEESKIYERARIEKKLEEANLLKFYIVRRIIAEEQIHIKELYGKNGSAL